MKDSRNVYLTNIPLKEAQERYLHAVDFSGVYGERERALTVDALNRITAKPVFAKKSSPSYNAAAMDGIAVIAEKTHGATEINPLRLKKGIDFEYINTGGHIKHPFDAVIMIEDVVELDAETVEIMDPAKNWQHVRPVGEDIVEGELIISANHQIRPFDIGALLAGQIREVEVYRQLRVGILPTGSEIIDVSDELQEGRIIESNASMFAALVQQYNALPRRYPVVKDDYGLIKEAILKLAEENDVVIINAGSSAGSKDYTVNVLREIGEVVIHGVATKPGKPAILALVKGKPVIGIPGYPVSAYFVFDFFVKPLIFSYNHQLNLQLPVVKATLSKRIVSSLKYEEFIRIKLGKVKDKLIATPLDRGAGVTMSLVRADGVLVVPQQSEGYEGSAEVDIQLYRPMEEIQNTIVSIGSHDMVMDLLGDKMKQQYNDLYLSSAHVGSLGGIMAMKKQECHIAPIHLLDSKTGDYNEAYVRQYIKEVPMAIIKFIRRNQGLMVQKGNPLKIKGIEDIFNQKLQYVNRQRGAGTRLLLDYYIEQHQADPEALMGYEREMTTHMAVAAAIASGTADCGLGILSAAEAMGLDFVPVAWEDYDLLIPQEMLKDTKIIRLLEMIKSQDFIATVEGLGGYDTNRIGEIILL